MKDSFISLFIVFIFLVSCEDHQRHLSDQVGEAPIRVERLAGDSLATSFMIWIKDTVETHKHEWHSETVYVIEGEATMYLNDQSQLIKSGDVIFIPKNTWHAVKVSSPQPLKVLSVQAPGFDGSDRVFKSTRDNVDADY